MRAPRFPGPIDRRRGRGLPIHSRQLGEGIVSFILTGPAAQPPAFADGYAGVARAALALWEATQDRRYLQRAIAWTRTLDQEFWDVVQGGYVYSRNTDLPEQVRTRHASTPRRVGQRHDDRVHGRRSTHRRPSLCRARQHADSSLAGDVATNYMQMSTFLNNSNSAILPGNHRLWPAIDARTQDLVKAVLGRSLQPPADDRRPGTRLCRPAIPPKARPCRRACHRLLSAAVWSVRRRSPARPFFPMYCNAGDSPMSRTAGRPDAPRGW